MGDGLPVISDDLLNEIAWAACVGLAALRTLEKHGSGVASEDLPRAEKAVADLTEAGFIVDMK